MSFVGYTRLSAQLLLIRWEVTVVREDVLAALKNSSDSRDELDYLQLSRAITREFADDLAGDAGVEIKWVRYED